MLGQSVNKRLNKALTVNYRNMLNVSSGTDFLKMLKLIIAITHTFCLVKNVDLSDYIIVNQQIIPVTCVSHQHIRVT